MFNVISDERKTAHTNFILSYFRETEHQLVAYHATHLVGRGSVKINTALYDKESREVGVDLPNSTQVLGGRAN